MSKEYPYTRKEAIKMMVINGRDMQYRGQNKDCYYFCRLDSPSIFAESRPGYIHGTVIPLECSEWRIYEEPKKKVKMWLWVYSNDNGDVFLTSKFYAIKEEVFLSAGSCRMVRRADWSMIEVDE